MNQAILAAGLPQQSKADLCAAIDGLVAVDGGTEKDVLGLIEATPSAKVVFLGQNVQVVDCVRICRHLAAFLPHVRVVQVVGPDDLKKLISIKNQVGTISVIEHPWRPEVAMDLAQELFQRSRMIQAEESFLATSLAAQIPGICRTRASTLSQTLNEGGAGSDRVVDLLDAAVTLRDGLCVEPRRDLDLLEHVRSEAARMVQIIGHVRAWHVAFASGAQDPGLHSLFDVKDGILHIKDLRDQLTPLTAPVGSTPTYQQCCLLALLTWAPSSARLRHTGDGVWALLRDTQVS